MIEQKFVIYNFLAKKLGVDTYDSLDAFTNALENNTTDKRCVATKYYDVFDIDKQEVIASVYLARGEFEWIKIVGNKITEHYRQTIKNGWCFIAYDILTEEPIEYYKAEGLVLSKYDYHTHEQTGFTNGGGWLSMPLRFKDKLKKNKYLHKVVYWAEKPYGSVVGLLT
jgi:hypothetical protein